MLLAVISAMAVSPAMLRVDLPQAPQTVYAIVGHQLLTGVSDPSGVDDTGMVTLRSADGAPLACKVAYGYRRGGLASFICSDGAQFRVPYQGYSPWSGSGGGVAAGQPVSLCYGLQPKDAARHLVAPAGYAVEVAAGRLVLRRSGL